jgi:hypothetical protein
MENISEEFIRGLVPRVKCAGCGEPYHQEDITAISRHDDTWLVNVTCGACRVRSLIAAAVKPGEGPGPSTLVATDLTPEEHPRFTKPVDSGDVLAMHYYLDGFDGDFKRLFETK